MPLSTANELASAVAGGVPFLLQPPIPPIGFSEADLQHLVSLCRIAASEPVAGSRIAASAMYYPGAKELVLRAWIESHEGLLQMIPIGATSSAVLYGDDGEIVAQASVSADPLGLHFIELAFNVQLALFHPYRAHVRLVWAGGSAERDIGLSVTR